MDVTEVEVEGVEKGASIAPSLQKARKWALFTPLNWRYGEVLSVI